MKIQSYVISVEKKDGSTVFLRPMSSSQTRASSTSGMTPEPGAARQWPIDTDKAKILSWMDDMRTRLKQYVDSDTMRVMIYEQTLLSVAQDDIEWRTSLQRSGVSKLSRMEIEALSLEKFEIERRLSK